MEVGHADTVIGEYVWARHIARAYVGPFRVNISKSGVGYSVGGTGSARCLPVAAATSRSASPGPESSAIRLDSKQGCLVVLALLSGIG